MNTKEKILAKFDYIADIVNNSDEMLEQYDTTFLLKTINTCQTLIQALPFIEAKQVQSGLTKSYPIVNTTGRHSIDIDYELSPDDIQGNDKETFFEFEVRENKIDWLIVPYRVYSQAIEGELKLEQTKEAIALFNYVKQLIDNHYRAKEISSKVFDFIANNYQEVSHEKQQLRFRRHRLLRPADHSVYRSQANRLYQLAVDLGCVPHLAFPCVLADPSHSCYYPSRLTVIAPFSKHCAKCMVLFSCPFRPHEGGMGTIAAGSAYPAQTHRKRKSYPSA